MFPFKYPKISDLNMYSLALNGFIKMNVQLEEISQNFSILKGKYCDSCKSFELELDEIQAKCLAIISKQEEGSFLSESKRKKEEEVLMPPEENKSQEVAIQKTSSLWKRVLTRAEKFYAPVGGFLTKAHRKLKAPIGLLNAGLACYTLIGFLSN